MSCTVLAVPYALAWVIAATSTAIVAEINNKKNFDNFESLENKEIEINHQDFYQNNIISEQTIIEKSFETPFMDREILMKTLEEHGVNNIEEDGFGKITGQVNNYSLTFEKMESDKPYFVKICCHQNDSAEEKVKDLTDEYTLNVQEEAYLSIIEKLEQNKMEIENEEVLDDNTIVLTINLE